MQVYAGKDAAGAPIYRPAARPIIVRDIMRHTAGFAYGPGNTPAHDAYVKADPMSLDNDLAELGRRVAKVPLLFDPGAQWSYSIAVDVQALLVEKLSGRPFAEYVRQHILDPLGMHDTAWRQPDERLPRLAAMYLKKDGKLARNPDAATRRLNFQNNKLTGGGFGLASTIDDYMRFARMLLGGGELDGVRILKPSTIRLMSVNHLDPRITERLFTYPPRAPSASAWILPCASRNRRSPKKTVEQWVSFSGTAPHPPSSGSIRPIILPPSFSPRQCRLMSPCTRHPRRYLRTRLLRSQRRLRRPATSKLKRCLSMNWWRCWASGHPAPQPCANTIVAASPGIRRACQT